MAVQLTSDRSMRHFFSRKTNNLIASFRGLPPDRSRAWNKKVKDLDAVMDTLVDRFKLGTTQPEETITNEWVSLVGENNAKYANPWRLDRGRTLYVQVSNPVVKQEMQFSKKVLLKRLNSLRGCEKIQEVIFRAG
ncbi:MAG: DUF721 domain-containing protein [Opitutales bacterium]|nr:DUF721 domain-containing protein [Opitutales bacterium]